MKRARKTIYGKSDIEGTDEAVFKLVVTRSGNYVFAVSDEKYLEMAMSSMALVAQKVGRDCMKTEVEQETPGGRYESMSKVDREQLDVESIKDLIIAEDLPLLSKKELMDLHAQLRKKANGK